MEIKFFAGDRVLDLSSQKLSIQESNSKVSDKMFSKFTFPFEIYMGEDFLKSFGDFESDESYGLESTFDGIFLLEDKLYKAKLNLLNVEGKKLTGQIDYGFEDLPNFGKKLSELPLENYKVNDIYSFAKSVCEKKYPQTNFNFPRVYTSKYSPDQQVWDAFDGYYNDLKTDGSEMRRNYIDEKGNIFNVNIIHPMPHILYVLKTGFKDAGLEMQGDILKDPVLAQRWIFSGTEYFTSKKQRRYEWNFDTNGFDELFLENGPDDYAKYQKFITIEKTGLYKIAGTIGFFKARKMSAQYVIKLNGKVIWSRIEGYSNRTISEDMKIDINFNVSQENSEMELFIYTQYHDSWKGNMANLLVTSNALEDINSNSLGDESGVVTNLNEIDLRKAVPEITFGDLVNIIRNWFNYDLDIVDNVVYMNKADQDPKDIKDINQNLPVPVRSLLQKKSFLLKPLELDNGQKLDAMFYDKDGAILNKEPREETTIIEINGYALPVSVPKPGGYNTAVVKKDSSDCLQLVWYDGLTAGQNNAKNPAGCSFPDLFYSHWHKWLRQRIYGSEYKFKRTWDADLFPLKIKDYIFAYNKVHIIKSWVKDYSNGQYEVDFTTEKLI